MCCETTERRKRRGAACEKHIAWRWRTVFASFQPSQNLPWFSTTYDCGLNYCHKQTSCGSRTQYATSTNGDLWWIRVRESFRFQRRVRRGMVCATLKVVGRSTRMRPRCCDTEICNCRGFEARLAAAAARSRSLVLRNHGLYDRWSAKLLPYTAPNINSRFKQRLLLRIANRCCAWYHVKPQLSQIWLWSHRVAISFCEPAYLLVAYRYSVTTSLANPLKIY